MLFEPVGYPDGDRISFAHAQGRGWNGAIYGGGHACLPGEIDRGFGDHKIKLGTAEHGGVTGKGTLAAGPGRF
ncbi:hypothetical protein GCM10022394_04930 [Zobellella aerophila]|uniref:Uncharacterized protein n=1 Tax=Zobellella aerophila TaxID=870480 RepID=A0ABP6V4I2_9GAMM